MIRTESDRVEVVPCPLHPHLFRWRILREGTPLDLPGYAYTSAWSASEAGRVALYWYRVLRAPVRERAPRAHDAA